MASALPSLVGFLADVLLAWRCWVIWGKHRWLRWVLCVVVSGDGREYIPSELQDPVTLIPCWTMHSLRRPPPRLIRRPRRYRQEARGGQDTGPCVGVDVLCDQQRDDLVHHLQDMVGRHALSRTAGTDRMVDFGSSLAMGDRELGASRSTRSLGMTAMRAIVESSAIAWAGILVVTFTATYGFVNKQGVATTVRGSFRYLARTHDHRRSRTTSASTPSARYHRYS
jgi:hypothetical protein